MPELSEIAFQALVWLNDHRGYRMQTDTECELWPSTDAGSTYVGDFARRFPDDWKNRLRELAFDYEKLIELAAELSHSQDWYDGDSIPDYGVSPAPFDYYLSVVEPAQDRPGDCLPGWERLTPRLRITDAGRAVVAKARNNGLVAGPGGRGGEHGELPRSQGVGLRVCNDSRLAYWNGRQLCINGHADFEILNALSAARGNVVSYTSLLALLKPYATANDAVIQEAPPEVKYAVSHIRNAFKNTHCPLTVAAIRNKGYRLSPDE